MGSLVRKTPLFPFTSFPPLFCSLARCKRGKMSWENYTDGRTGRTEGEERHLAGICTHTPFPPPRFAPFFAPQKKPPLRPSSVFPNPLFLFLLLAYPLTDHSFNPPFPSFLPPSLPFLLVFSKAAGKAGRGTAFPSLQQVSEEKKEGVGRGGRGGAAFFRNGTGRGNEEG